MLPRGRVVGLRFSCTCTCTKGTIVRRLECSVALRETCTCTKYDCPELEFVNAMKQPSETSELPRDPLWEPCLLPVIIFVLLALRVWKASQIPLFIDEAFHLHFARDFTRFHFKGALDDGKFLYFFIIAPGLWLGHPVIVSRLISAGISAGTGVLLF